MFDPRIYRAGFVPALAAFVALLFSLEPAPAPVESPITPSFDGGETTRLARNLASVTPDRSPGSPGDREVADRVQERFEEVPGGEVSVQEIEATANGTDVLLRNVLLTLPGELEEVLLVVAARDSPDPPAAASTATATATLMTLAEELGGSRHQRTLVLASTSGLTTGATGARKLVERLPAAAGIDAAVVLTHPGVSDRHAPFVFGGSAEPGSLPPALLATAEEIASTRLERDAGESGGLNDLARLSLPSGVGEVTALDDEGVLAVAVSGGGKRPPPDEEDGIGSISRTAVFESGSIALELIHALDERPAGELSTGPGAYVRIGDSPLPGWTIALLGLALVVPSLLAAGDIFVRERRRRPRATNRAVPWTLERVLVPLAPLLLLYLLGLVGLLTVPPFPWDPARFPPGGEGVAAAIATGIAIAIAALLVRPLRTPLDSEPPTLAATCGLLLCGSVLGIWLINPYAATLLAPLTHLWLLPARVEGPPSRLAIGVTAVVLLLPAAGAAVIAGSELGVGASLPWHLLLLVLSGQIGLLQSVLFCGLLGGMLGCVAAATAAPMSLPVPDSERQSVRGPAGYAGPGSLGGAPSGTGGRA